MANGVQRRDNFRIVYPLAERPQVVVLGKSYAVCDLSVAGLRIFEAKDLELKVAALDGIEMELQLCCGKVAKIRGKFLRSIGDDVVLILTQYVPATYINLEQIYLKSRYPGFK
jgi:hypothetical protein